MLVGGRQLGQVRNIERDFIYRCKIKFNFGWSHGKSGNIEWDRVQPCAAATTRVAICSSLGRSIEPLFKKFLLFSGLESPRRRLASGHVGARSDELRLPCALPVGVRPEECAGEHWGRQGIASSLCPRPLAAGMPEKPPRGLPG